MKHALLLLLLLICLFTSPITITHAQDDDTSQGWPIEERCIGNHIPPASDWTFDGTILMTGRHGVHAYQQDWDTPRVIAFTRDNPSIYLWGTPGLSPDGHWYVATMGTESSYSASHSSVTSDVVIEAIVVYSTVNFDEIYRVPWTTSHHLDRHYTSITRMIWIDNEHLLYGGFIINPFDGTTQEWEGLSTRDTSGAFTNSLIISPDFTWAVSLGEGNYGFYGPVFPYRQGLYDVITSEMIAEIDLVERQMIIAG